MSETESPIHPSGVAVAGWGQALSEPVFWTGRQWAVTAYGIERRDGLYVIEAERLWEVGAYDGWEEVMRRKDNVDIADFRAALEWARDNSDQLDQPEEV